MASAKSEINGAKIVSVVIMFVSKDVNLVGFREMFALLGKMCYKHLTSALLVCYN